MLSLAIRVSCGESGVFVRRGRLMTARSIRIASTLLVVAWVITALPAAQERPAPAAPAAAAPQGPETTFRAGVDSISVDAIVTDRQGRPVTDLKPEDFEIREGGKAQAIENFRLVQIDDGRDDPSASRDILSQADQDREVASENNRLLVIFLDDYHTRLGNSLAFRQKLAQFVYQLSPRDLVALITPLMPASTLTFSRNHEATAGQIMNFVGRKYDYRPRNALEERYSQETPQQIERLRNAWVIEGLRSVCEYMGSFRAGRKTLLYVSEGLTNNMPSGVLTTGTANGPTMPIMGPDPTMREQSQQYFDSVELISDLQRVFNSAARTNTSIYPVDPRGLAPSEFSVADVVSQAMDKQILTQTTELLRTIADQTDGRAIVNRNDPLPALQQMVKDSSTYYLMSYTSTFAYRDGKFHEFQVRVKRPGVEVRARRGYWAVSAEEMARASTPKVLPTAQVTDALNALATTDESARRQPITLWLGATKGEAEKARVSLVWEANGAQSTLASERVERVNVSAFSIYGDALFSGPVPREADAATAAGRVMFDAPAGSVRVKVDVENAAGRRLESTDINLDVPDFTSTATKITTPFVYRGRTARDIQAVRAAASPLPTTARTFSRSERFLLRFGAYGPGGAAPTVTMRILNQGGASVASMPPPVRLPNGLYESEVALGGFPPSDYLIEISADANGDIARTLLAVRVTG